MADINELAEKKLKSRMTKIRKCNREPEEKEKFSEKFGVSVEMEFQNKNPVKSNKESLPSRLTMSLIIERAFSLFLTSSKELLIII